MIVGPILPIIIAILVYLFWFVRGEFARVLKRIDQAVLAMSRMNREMMQHNMQFVAQQIRSLPYIIEDANSKVSDDETIPDEDFEEAANGPGGAPSGQDLRELQQMFKEVMATNKLEEIVEEAEEADEAAKEWEAELEEAQRRGDAKLGAYAAFHRVSAAREALATAELRQAYLASLARSAPRRCGSGTPPPARKASRISWSARCPGI